MSRKRTILSASIATLKAHRITPPQVRDAIKRIQDLAADPTADPRTRLMAAKHLVDHDWEVFEHDNPSVQKSEILHTGLPEIPRQLEVVIVSAAH